MSGWIKIGDFKIDVVANDSVLVFQGDYKNVQTNAVIKKIMLRGYCDNEFLLFIKPVNSVTAVMLKNKFTQTPSSLQCDVQATGQIGVKVSNINALNICLGLLSEVDSLDEIKDDIKQYFLLFNEKNPILNKKSSPQNINQDHIPKSYVINENELKLFSAIRDRNIHMVKDLLVLGVSPNLPPYQGYTPLIYAVWQYIETKDENIRSEWLLIIKALLDYRADYSQEHAHLYETALSSATDHGCTLLVDLLFKYAKKVEFKVCGEDEIVGKKPTIINIKQHVKRISFFEEQAKKIAMSPATQVGLSKPSYNNGSIVNTEFVQGDNLIVVELMITANLPDSYFDKLFNLYDNNFHSLNETSKNEKRYHLQEKFGINNPSKKIYCDVIKVKEEIVGFNLYEIHNDIFMNKLYQVVYCSLAYIEKAYRGTRLMSLLSFRTPHALKLAHPNVETYIFYDAIHPNSFRQGFEMDDLYPLYRTEKSVNFLKHVAEKIYGEERANKFDGKEKFYWPTESRVQGSPIIPDEYDLPCVIEKFDEITEGKNGVPGCGGVPEMWPVTATNFDRLKKIIDTKLNNKIFAEHVMQFAELVYGCKPAENFILDNFVACLLPNSLARRS